MKTYITSNRNFYFETSAVNYMTDKYTYTDAIATKAFQNVKGNVWYLSPVTLWEILLTSDKQRRENIIIYCQHLFHEQLIQSPSEFIIKYINFGCPVVEKKYDFHSKLSLNDTWKDICDDKHKTLVYDYDALKDRMKLFQKFSKQLDKIINRVVLDISVSDEELSIQQFVNHWYNQVKDDLEYHETNDQKVFKISILFIFYILCLEADIDNSPQQIFWSQVGLEPSIDRLDYLMSKHRDLVFRGPIYQMAIMAYHQISLGQKTSRGLFMDCLHSIYITYADIFITNDDHFKTLKERDVHPNFRRLMHLSEIRIATHQREVYTSKNDNVGFT